MAIGLYSGAPSISLGNSLYKNRLGLFSSASGLTTGYLPTPSLALSFETSQYSLNGLNYTSPASLAGYTFTRTSGGYAETVSGTSMFFPELRTNLVLQSQNMATVWTANFGAGSSVTRTANYSAAPDGTLTATRLQYTNANYAQIYEQLTVTTATVYNFSVWLKSNTGANQVLSIGDNAHSPMLDVTVTSVWQRFSITQTTTSANYITKILSGIASSYDFLAWGAQLEPVTNPACTYPMDYIPTTTTAVSVSGGYGIANGGLMWFTGTRTNLLTYSEQFDNAAWTKSNATVTANAIASPSGTITAEKLIEDTATSEHFVDQPFTAASSTTYTYSAYLKAGERSQAVLRFSVASVFVGGSVQVGFTLTGSGSSFTISGSPTAQSITAVGNGWYRCSISVLTVAAVAATPGARIQLYDGTSSNYTGNGTSGAYLWGAQLESAADTRITYPTAYIPTTTAAVSVDTPRITNKGYLSEEARTNLVNYSQQFDVAGVGAWQTGGSPVITANQTTAPDGTLTADLWTRITTASSYALQVVTKAASAITYTTTFYVKKSVGDYCALRLQGTYPARADVTFNISTGAISSAATATSTFTGASATITSSANGFYKITLTATSDATTNLHVVFSFLSTNAQIDGTDTASNSAGYIWGAQLEQAAFATSYIPTTTAAATRAADAFTFTSINTASWFNSAQGSLCATYQYDWANSANGTGKVAAFLPVASGSYAALNASGGINSGWYLNGLGFGSAVSGITNRQDISYTVPNKFSGSLNGATTLTSNSSDYAGTSTSMPIGYRASDQWLNGYVKNITYYRNALTDAQLQAITNPVIPQASFNAIFSGGLFSTSADGVNNTYYPTATAMPGYTFTRASGGYAETVAGNLVYFNSDIPRITDKGYLSEEARTNLALQSQNFENASWNAVGISVTADQATAPDNTTTADLFTSTSSFSFVSQSFASLTGGANYTVTRWVKSGGITPARFFTIGFHGQPDAYFDIQTATTASSGTGIGFVNATITQGANGWWKLTATWTKDGTQATNKIYLAFASSLTNQVAAIGVTAYSWGAQLEAGAFATSYIPTTTAAATRAADNLNYTAMSSILTANGPYTFTGSYIVAQNITGNSAIFSGYQTPSLGLTTTNVYLGRPSVANYVSKAITNNIGTVNKVAGRFASGDFAVTANGLAPTKSTTTVTWPAYSQISIGIEGVSINGYVQNATIYPTALTDAQLQAITA